MIQKINKKLRNRKGFTLIELVVVIAVLGILAAIAVPKLTTFTDKAKKAADDQLIAVIAKGLQMDVITGTIKSSSDSANVTIKVDDSLTATYPNATNLTPNTLKTTIESYSDKNEFQYYKGKTITFTVKKDGTVTTSIADTPSS